MKLGSRVVVDIRIQFGPEPWIDKNKNLLIVGTIVEDHGIRFGDRDWIVKFDNGYVRNFMEGSLREIKEC